MGAQTKAKVLEGIVDRVLNQVPAGHAAYNEVLNQRVVEAAQLLVAPAHK